MERTLSTTQAAEELGISYMTVIRLIRDGTLKAYRKTSRNRSHYIVDKTSVNDLIAQRQTRQGRPTAEINPPNLA